MLDYAGKLRHTSPLKHSRAEALWRAMALERCWTLSQAPPQDLSRSSMANWKNMKELHNVISKTFKDIYVVIIRNADRDRKHPPAPHNTSQHKREQVAVSGSMNNGHAKRLFNRSLIASGCAHMPLFKSFNWCCIHKWNNIATYIIIHYPYDTLSSLSSNIYKMIQPVINQISKLWFIFLVSYLNVFDILGVKEDERHLCVNTQALAACIPEHLLDQPNTSQSTEPSPQQAAGRLHSWMHELGLGDHRAICRLPSTASDIVEGVRPDLPHLCMPHCSSTPKNSICVWTQPPNNLEWHAWSSCCNPPRHRWSVAHVLRQSPKPGQWFERLPEYRCEIIFYKMYLWVPSAYQNNCRDASQNNDIKINKMNVYESNSAGDKTKKSLNFVTSNVLWKTKVPRASTFSSKPHPFEAQWKWHCAPSLPALGRRVPKQKLHPQASECKLEWTATCL